MIKSVLRLAVILVIGVIVYNYFLGSPEEKAKSKEIIGKTVDIGKAGVGLLKEEYQKFKDGKYDQAIDKVGNLLKDAKEKGGAYLEDIKEWEERRQSWKEKKEKLIQEIDNAGGEMSEDQKAQLEKLEAEGKSLAKEGQEIQEKTEKE